MDIALAVGGAALNASLAVGFDRSSRTLKFIELFQGKNIITFDNDMLDRLEFTMDWLSEVLVDAEDKQGNSPLVKGWLVKVKQSVHHAEDLLDELNAECLRLEQDYHLQQQKSEADPELILRSTKEIMENLKGMTEKLEYFENQIQRLGLQNLDLKEKYAYREPSSSVINRLQIFGRESEKEKMIERLLSDEGASGVLGVSVIAITGMGGIGKTTLAQLVYDDDRIKEKFPKRGWVCVSEDYNALRITKSILMEVDSAAVDVNDDFNRVQVKLRDSLAKKEPCLIILDDIWNENYNDWSSLKAPLNFSSRGSKIIVTTRNQKVARMMQNEPSHHLQPIREDESWNLFKSEAFDNGDSFHCFETIGKEIVEKCKGLPVAIKTIAGVLRPERDINVWHNILSSRDWVADILPVLRLSYKHLPSTLKRCFAFCAVFHKEIPFNKDEVIQLWMANDLIKPATQEAGRRYFEELNSLSFFESVDDKTYVMHDLINDLAISVAGNSCTRRESYPQSESFKSIGKENEILHFSCLMDSSNQISDNWKDLAQFQSLRTILPVHPHSYSIQGIPICPFDVLLTLKRLRAINLSQHNISEVPNAIGDLKQLRLLNLALTRIKRLPNEICKCVNLQTLILANCGYLVELPKNMGLLINLQRLDIRGVWEEPFIENMATWIRMFEDTPNIFIVADKIHGNALEHLDKLQLCDSLKIIELQDVDVDKAKARLVEKFVANLTFEWSGIATSLEKQLAMFVKLKPHLHTRHLTIKGYKGRRYPEWLENDRFSNMESLYLVNCRNCFSLPRLGHLSALQKLYLYHMDGISEMPSEYEFSSLESLEISCCNNILSFPEGGLAAPKLKMLVVRRCKKMKSLPAKMHTQHPLLTYLNIEHCPEMECFSDEYQFPCSLKSLCISHCKKPKKWGLHNLFSLLELSLTGFDFTLFPDEGLLPTTLQTLIIWEFSNLESLNEKLLQHLCSLKSLQVKNCQTLKKLPEEKLHFLSELQIISCGDIESIPEGLVSTLSNLCIRNCPKLAARTVKEKGEDWPKVSHIPFIEIDGRSILP